MILYTLLIILALFHGVYFLIHRKLQGGLKLLGQTSCRNSNPQEAIGTRPVSVLIAVRNEEKSIEACLNSLVSQQYPADKLEFVIVNDRSTDATSQILDLFSIRNPGRFKIMTISEKEKSFSPKKHALSKGISLCTGEIILSTDGDCIFPRNWVARMAFCFEHDTGMVLGPVVHSLLPGMNKFTWGIQAVEFLSHSIVSASLIANRFPINASANNMAYLRKAFNDAGGFEAHKNIISGDDDFLLQKISSLKSWKIKYSTHYDTVVSTAPCETIGQIWEQRKRWASKCAMYGKSQVAFLSYIYVYYLMTFLFLLGGLFSCTLLSIGTLSWGLKTAMDFATFHRGARMFSQQHLLKWFIPAAVIHIPLIIFAVIFGSFGSFTWKGQKTRKKA